MGMDEYGEETLEYPNITTATHSCSSCLTLASLAFVEDFVGAGMKYLCDMGRV
jgi:hypothetical protein